MYLQGSEVPEGHQIKHFPNLQPFVSYAPKYKTLRLISAVVHGNCFAVLQAKLRVSSWKGFLPTHLLSSLLIWCSTATAVEDQYSITMSLLALSSLSSIIQPQQTHQRCATSICSMLYFTQSDFLLLSFTYSVQEKDSLTGMQFPCVS